MIKVRAVKTGFYGNQLRTPGAEFEIANAKELGSWMVKLEDAKKANPASKSKDPEAAGNPDSLV